MGFSWFANSKMWESSSQSGPWWEQLDDFQWSQPSFVYDKNFTSVSFQHHTFPKTLKRTKVLIFSQVAFTTRAQRLGWYECPPRIISTIMVRLWSSSQVMFNPRKTAASWIVGQSIKHNTNSLAETHTLESKLLHLEAGIDTEIYAPILI